MARARHPRWRVHLLGAGALHHTLYGRSDALREAWVQSLASALVLLNAPSLVLARGSNWARVIDDLRRTRIDHLCGSCTRAPYIS